MKKLMGIMVCLTVVILFVIRFSHGQNALCMGECLKSPVGRSGGNYCENQYNEAHKQLDNAISATNQNLKKHYYNWYVTLMRRICPKYCATDCAPESDIINLSCFEGVRIFIYRGWSHWHPLCVN